MSAINSRICIPSDFDLYSTIEITGINILANIEIVDILQKKFKFP